MSLHRYFSHQDTPHMSEHMRMRVYSDFLKKKERQGFSRRSHILQNKKIWQSSMVVLSGLILIASSFLTNVGSPSSTVADNIGHIVKQSGTIDILSNGRTIHSDSIQLYDEVQVADKAAITIRMNNGFDVAIPGPARFTIVPSSEETDMGSYTIQFITSNNYIAVDSINNTNKELATSMLAIQMDGVVIKPERKNNDDKVSFVIDPSRVQNTSESKKTIINKGGSDIVVITSDTANKGESGEDVAIVASAQITEIQTNTGSSSIAIITSTPLSSGTIIATAYNDTNETKTTATSTTIKTVSTKEIPITRYDENGKLILNKDEINQLKSYLHNSFLENNLRNNIAFYHLLGDKNASSIARSNLIARFDSIAHIIGVSTYATQSNNIKDLIEYADYLKEKSAKVANMPYMATRNITIINNRLHLIQVYPYGMTKEMYDNNSLPSVEEVFQKAGITNTILNQNNYRLSK